MRGRHGVKGSPMIIFLMDGNQVKVNIVLFGDNLSGLARIKFDVYRKCCQNPETIYPKNVSSVYLCGMITEQQEKWLKQITELFLRFGIKALTMDDVARELGVSKKTLYQFVESKDDLVNKVIEGHLDLECRRAEVMSQTAADALDEMMMVIRDNVQDMRSMKANFIFDLQKYHRSAWERVQVYQREYLYKVVLDNLQRGVEEGLYRDDFDLDVIAKLHLIQTFSIFDDVWFPKPPYTFDHLFKESILCYLYSIVSDQGRQLLKEKLQEGMHL